MKLPRFRIRSLLGVVLFVAIAAAALRAADDAWDGGLLGLTALSLLTAVLLAVHRTDRKRAFWLGFTLFGWAYLLASLIPPLESRLPTNRGLLLIDSKIPGRQRTWVSAVFSYTSTASTNPVQTVAFSPQGDTLVTSMPGVVRLWDAATGKLLAGPGGTTESFVRIGHSLMALILAFVGGHLSRHLYDRGRGERVMPLPSGDSPAPREDRPAP